MVAVLRDVFMELNLFLRAIVSLSLVNILIGNLLLQEEKQEDFAVTA